MKRPPVTDGELAWFDWKAYSPPKLSALSLERWAVIIFNRVALRSSLNRGDPSYVVWCFENCMGADPTCMDGSHHGAWRSAHRTATPTVSLMDYFQLSDLHSSAIRRVPDDPTEPVALPNGAFAAGYGADAMLVPVMVNLAATRGQLIDDFASWLEGMSELIPPAKNRDYRTTTAEWAENHYLPYFDLWLFAEASRKSISPARMVDLLGISTPTKAAADQIKVPRKSLAVFTWDTLNAINMQIARGG